MYGITTATEKISKLTKRVRGLQGGTSAGKTIGTLEYLIVEAQNDEVPTLTSIVAESFPHLRRGAMRDFESLLKSQNYWDDNSWDKSNSVYTLPSGSKIEFFSVEQSDKVRGARRDRLFINEANNIPFATFEELEVRTKDFIIADWNPVSEFWWHTEIVGKRTDAEMIILTYKDNEGLSQEIIDAIEQRKDRPGWWKVFGLGELGEAEGKIYKDWHIIDSIPNEARLERYGLDFGYTNDPTAIVAIYYYNGGYILDEIAYQKGLSNKNIADIILNKHKALVVADSAEPKSIDEISGYGISIIGAEKGPDSVRHSIQIVQDEQISVTSRSSNVIREYRNFLWEVDKNGKVLQTPEPTFKHSMDAVAYGMVSIAPIKRKIEFNQVVKKQEDKRTLKEFDFYKTKRSTGGYPFNR